jgi:sulfoacetaldehyde acetyltransferase
MKEEYNMQMNGGEAIVQSLVQAGIQYVFGIVGSSVLEVFDLLPQTGLNYVGVRHEQVGGHMADAYARVSGQPAVCLVQNGAGLTNLVTAVATAYRARSPMIVISGSPTSKQLFTDAYQEIDHVHIMKPITKWSHLVNRADRIAEAMQQAIREALSPPFGPTFVDVPRDFLYEIADVRVEKPDQFMSTHRCPPDNTALEQVALQLQQAHSPVILVGGGIAWAQASDEVGALATKLSAPICTTYGHNDAVANDHPWYVGSLGRGGSKAAMEAFRRADLILALGTRMDPFSFLPYYGEPYFPQNAAIIQVANDPRQIGKNYPITLGIVADAKLFTQAVLARLSSQSDSLNSLQQVQEWRTKWQREMAVQSQWSGQGPLSMEAAYAALAEILPVHTIRTVDIGSSPSFAYSMLAYSGPRTLLPPLGLGGVGFSLPAALGAKLAAPERPVVALMGDGAFSMSFSALFTAVEYALPIVGIVFDNAAWGAEKANQQYFYDANYVGTNLHSPDLVRLASAMGVHACSAETPSDIKEAVGAALQRKDRASIIRIPVDPERFPLPARRDALKKPERHVYR